MPPGGYLGAVRERFVVEAIAGNSSCAAFHIDLLLTDSIRS